MERTEVFTFSDRSSALPIYCASFFPILVIEMASGYKELKVKAVFALVVCAAFLLFSFGTMASADSTDTYIDKKNETVNVDGDVIVIWKEGTVIVPGHFYCFDSDVESGVILPDGIGIEAPVGIFLKEGVSVNFVFPEGGTDGKDALLVYTASSISDSQVKFTENGYNNFNCTINEFIKYDRDTWRFYVTVIDGSIVTKDSHYRHSEYDYVREPDAPTDITVKADKDMGIVISATDSYRTIGSGNYDFTGLFGVIDLIGYPHTLMLTDFTGSIRSIPENGGEPLCVIKLSNFTGELKNDSESTVTVLEWDDGSIDVYKANNDQEYLLDMAPDYSTLNLRKNVPISLSKEHELMDSVLCSLSTSLQIPAGLKLVVHGRLVFNNSEITVYGELVSDGSLYLSTAKVSGKLISEGYLRVSNVLENKGDITVSGTTVIVSMVNETILTNFGKMSIGGSSENSGTIVNDGDGVMNVGAGLRNTGKYLLRSDNGFNPEDGTGAAIENLYTGLNGNIVIDAPGKILGFANGDYLAVSITSRETESVVGGLYLYLEGKVSYWNKTGKALATVSNVHFDTTGIVINGTSATVSRVMVSNVTFGTEADPIVPCSAYGPMEALLSSMGPTASLNDGAFACSEGLEGVIVTRNAEVHVQSDEVHTYNNINWTCTDGILRIWKDPSSANGVLDLSGKTLHEVFGDSVKKVIICEGITAIDPNAFRGSDIESLSVPGTVEKIEAGTFAGCRSLGTVAISAGVLAIGDGAFEGCEALTDVTLSETITEIGQRSFFGCAISTIYVPFGTVKIGSLAFADNPLTVFYISSGVKEIGDSAFPFTKWYDYDGTTEVPFSAENLAGHFWTTEGMPDGSVCRQTQGDDTDYSGSSGTDPWKVVASIALIASAIAIPNLIYRRS